MSKLDLLLYWFVGLFTGFGLGILFGDAMWR